MKRTSMPSQLLVMVALSLFVQSMTLADARLTANQAIQVAQTYCQAIGQPVTVAGQAQFPVPSEMDVPLNHWQPRWYVKFTGQATLEVVDASGIIASYENGVSSTQEDITRAAGTAIPQPDAISRATAALQATGQTSDLAFDRAQEALGNNPPTSTSHDWDVDWTRTYGEYLYQQQGANVTLAAETGRVKHVRLYFSTPPPANANLIVTEDQAQDVANALLTSAGLTVTEMHPHLLLSRPNTFWQDGNEDELPMLPVLSWVYWFVEPGPRTGEVHVDAQTGQVIGGYEEGYRGGGGAAPKIPFGKLNLKAFQPGKATKSAVPPLKTLTVTPLRQALATAEQVTLFPASKNAPPLVALNTQSNPQMLQALGKTTAWQAAKPARAKVFRLALTQGGKTRNLTLFSSNVGLIGSGTEWYTVPAAFNAWVKTLAAPKIGK